MVESVLFEVTGMTCGGCENAVTRAVSRLPGVQRVVASHASGTVAVDLETDEVAPAAIAATIRTLGYDVNEPGPRSSPSTPAT